MKHVAWYGVGIREALGYTWRNGDVVPIEDDDVALNLLTQPGERFVDVTPAEPAPQQDEGQILTPVETLAKRIRGIGHVRAAELAERGIVSVADLAGLDEAEVRRLVDEIGALSEAQVNGWIKQAKEVLGGK